LRICSTTFSLRSTSVSSRSALATILAARRLAFAFGERASVCAFVVGRQRGRRATTVPPGNQRRSLKMELLPPNSRYELPTAFIQGK
jgi:hypothetical protein